MKNTFLNGRLCALLSSMYLCRPNRESLTNWRQLLAGEPLAGAKCLSEALDNIDLGSEQELENVLWEYTRLFIGPDRLPCPPLESVYTSPQRLVMQEAHDEVRQYYARIGVEVGSPDVMPDHIGAELNFLAILFYKMECEPEKRSFYKSLAEDFLITHLRNWVPRFTADMEKAAELPLYKALARVTRESLGLNVPIKQ